MRNVLVISPRICSAVGHGVSGGARRSSPLAAAAVRPAPDHRRACRRDSAGGRGPSGLDARGAGGRALSGVGLATGGRDAESGDLPDAPAPTRDAWAGDAAAPAPRAGPASASRGRARARRASAPRGGLARPRRAAGRRTRPGAVAAVDGGPPLPALDAAHWGIDRVCGDHGCPLGRADRVGGAPRGRPRRATSGSAGTPPCGSAGCTSSRTTPGF